MCGCGVVAAVTLILLVCSTVYVKFVYINNDIFYLTVKKWSISFSIAGLQALQGEHN